VLRLSLRDVEGVDEQVAVVRERDLDQPLQPRVGEKVPPSDLDGRRGRATRSRLVRGTGGVGRRNRRCGTLIHRLQRAAGREHRDAGQREETSCQGYARALHARLRLHDAAPPRTGSSAGCKAGCAAFRFGLNTFSVITKKNIGTRRGARNVAVSMPPITPRPTEFSLPEPAPVAIASGRTPSTNASDVMRIGRSRSFAAS